jgi:hypothetical protein
MFSLEDTDFQVDRTHRLHERQAIGPYSKSA